MTAGRLLTALLTIAATANARRMLTEEDIENQVMKSDELIGYSTPELDKDLGELKCGVCVAVLLEGLHKFTALRNLYDKDTPKEYELVDEIDTVCEETGMMANGDPEFRGMGLKGVHESKMITTHFLNPLKEKPTKDYFVYNGGWVGKWYENVCPQYADRVSEHAVDIYNRKKDVKICPECKGRKMRGHGVYLLKSERSDDGTRSKHQMDTFVMADTIPGNSDDEL